jgi:hypothetical protein
MPGGRKQQLCAAIAGVVGRPIRSVSAGQTEPKQTFVDVVEALNLPISTKLRKPWLGEAIAEFAGLAWGPDCDSRSTPSGGGDNVRVEGLEKLLQAARLIKKRGNVKSRAATVAASALVDIPRIRLRKVALERSKALADDAFSGRTDPARRRFLLEKALNGHFDLVNRLIAAFQRAGLECLEDPKSVDLLARRNGGAFLVEVKTLAGSSVSTTRAGLAQLFEYAFRLRKSVKDPTLVLAVDRKLRGPAWLVPYIVDGRQVNLVWLEKGSIRVEGARKTELRAILSGSRKR